MSVNIQNKLGIGLSAKEFIAKMTKNKDAFQNWYDGFLWSDNARQSFFENYQSSGLRCVIIAADWCGDVVRNVPVVLRLMEAASIPVEMLIMEENLDLIDQFLTMGGRSIPVILFVRDNGDVVGRFGPRPTYVQEPMVLFKQTYTDKNAPEYEDKLKETRQEVVRRYGEGNSYHKLIEEEIQAILSDV